MHPALDLDISQWTSSEVTSDRLRDVTGQEIASAFHAHLARWVAMRSNTFERSMRIAKRKVPGFPVW